MEEPETEIDRPCDFIDVLVDCDRTEHQHYVPNAVKGKQESINGTTIGVTAYSPSSRTEGRVPPGCFYTPANHGASSPSSSSPSSKQMSITRHSHSLPSTSDFTIPAPPTVGPAPTPLLSPAVPTPWGSSPEGRIETQVGRAGQGGKGFTGKKSSKSVSRLCFPFVTTSQKKKDGRKSSVPATSVVSAPASVSHVIELASSLPLRHKYSCSPTRLSGKGASPSKGHQRHAYANHGYSHEALEHVKWFWNVRREGSVVEMKPQFARTIHPQLRGTVGEPSPGGPRSPSSTATTTDPETVPASIHPRRGDISALRDPQCVDRTFCTMGVWTIAKMVWMVEVDVGVERMEREREKERRRRRSRLRMSILWDVHESDEGDGDEGGLDASHRTTSMSSLSDDSEMTLVEDEPSASFLEKDEGGRVATYASDTDEEDDEGLHMVIRGRKFTPRVNGEAQGSARSTARPASSSTWTSPGRELSDSDMHLDKSAIDRSLPRALYQTRLAASTHCCQSEWATDWTGRWEIVKSFSREVGCL